MFFTEDYPKREERLPRALAEHVMAQLEDPDNLARFADPAHRLITIILMRCGLRVTDALRLRNDCLVADAEGAPYLRYLNHKMKRDALVPIDEQLRELIAEHRTRTAQRWPAGTPGLFPRPTKNIDGTHPIGSPTYRMALLRWLAACDIRDEHGQPVHLTPHQWRHTLGTRLINRDVPQEVVRRILDHDSAQMTGHYARLHDTTVRRQWEAARKVDIHGATVTLDPAGPLAEAAWAKQRLGRATQALPNGYCGLPVQQSCPHANACLTCPMFLTTGEFLPQHRQQRQQTLQLITAAEARGQQRLAEMNRQVLHNLDNIITALDQPTRTGETCGLTTASTSSPPPGSGTNTPAPRRSRRCTNSTEPAPCSPSNPSPITPGSPGPGSTRRPTSKTRSAGCATSADTNRARRYPPPSAPATTPCACASKSPTAATVNSPRRTSDYAANSPRPRPAPRQRCSATRRTADNRSSVTIGPCSPATQTDHTARRGHPPERKPASHSHFRHKLQITMSRLSPP